MQTHQIWRKAGADHIIRLIFFHQILYSLINRLWINPVLQFHIINRIGVVPTIYAAFKELCGRAGEKEIRIVAGTGMISSRARRRCRDPARAAHPARR